MWPSPGGVVICPQCDFSCFETYKAACYLEGLVWLSTGGAVLCPQCDTSFQTHKAAHDLEELGLAVS